MTERQYFPDLVRGSLEQTGLLPAVRRNPEMIIGKLGGYAPAGCAVQEADLHQERLVDVFDGVGVFGEGCG